jgi:hypothetical protein
MMVEWLGHSCFLTTSIGDSEAEFKQEELSALTEIALLQPAL